MQTLVAGRTSYGYGAILDNLASCSPAGATIDTVNHSSWCAGCAGGRYAVGVLPAVAADYDGYASRVISG